MFTPSRDEARRFLAEAWAKQRDGRRCRRSSARSSTSSRCTPRYHALLEDADRNLDRDFAPEAGAVNPFLHLSLHLAVAEQLAIDQPPGIRAEFERLRAHHGDEHDALHDLVECLGEVVWQAQRAGGGPDASLYLSLLASMPRRL